MAKSRSFFGLRKGSTKSHTYSIFNGQQVTKDRVDQVKNPRSEAQMVQRMVLKTAGLAYSAFKQIVDHSFEGTTYGLQSMMAFMRTNTLAVRSNAKQIEEIVLPKGKQFEYVPYQSENFKPGCYVIAKGSASPIAITPVIDDTTANKLAVKLLGDSNKATTAADLFALLGIAVGDLCTVCFVWAEQETRFWHFDFVRITALATGDVALTAGNYSEYIKVESTQAVDSVVFGTADTPNGITITVAAANQDADVDNDIVAIHSVLSDGKWLRSNAEFTIGSSSGSNGSYYDALPTYPVGQSFVLNGGNF